MTLEPSTFCRGCRMALRILAAEWAKSAEAEDDNKDNDQPGAVVKAEERTDSTAHVQYLLK